MSARDRLGSLSWRGFAAVVLCCVALSAWTWSGTLLAPKTVTFDEHMEYFLSLIQRNLLTYVTIYVLVALADRLPLTGLRRHLALGGALFIAVMASVQLRCAVAPDHSFWVYGSIATSFCNAFPTWRT